MGGTPLKVAITPEILIGGADSRRLMLGLQSMIVHSDDEGSQARLQVLAQLTDLLPDGLEFGRTKVEIRLDGRTTFAGELSQVEALAPEAEPPTLVLDASGTAPVARTKRAVPLTYGSELLSVSVRRRPGSISANCVTSASSLRVGSRVGLATPDRDFGGVFTVMELWHRYDSTHGLRTELRAEA